MSRVYETIIVAETSGEEFHRAVESAMYSPEAESFGFELERADEERATIKFPITGFYWGEQLTIDREHKAIRIISQFRLPLQIFDWGKNRKNVNAVRAALLRALNRSA